MRIVTSAQEWDEHRRQEESGPVCVLVGPQDLGAAGAPAGSGADRGIAREVAEHLGLRLPMRPGTARRPSAAVDGDQLELVLFVLGADRSQHRLEMLAAPSGLLVAADDAVLQSVRAHLGDGRLRDGAALDDTWAMVVAIILGVARRCEEILDDLDDECQAIAERVTGYRSSPERRGIARMRTDLFRIQEFQAAQQELLSKDEETAQHLLQKLDDGSTGSAGSAGSAGSSASHGRRSTRLRHLLQRAAGAFAANRALAERLYAMLGDVLAEQDAVVNERLTLVATIFLPLTLATGFFGMNFAWMEDRVGSLTAFVLLGVVLPVAITLATLAVVRRLTRSA